MQIAVDTSPLHYMCTLIIILVTNNVIHVELHFERLLFLAGSQLGLVAHTHLDSPAKDASCKTWGLWCRNKTSPSLICPSHCIKTFSFSLPYAFPVVFIWLSDKWYTYLTPTILSDLTSPLVCWSCAVFCRSWLCSTLAAILGVIRSKRDWGCLPNNRSAGGVPVVAWFGSETKTVVGVGQGSQGWLSWELTWRFGRHVQPIHLKLGGMVLK